MQKKNIRINSTPKRLCILNYEESQNIFGVFSNADLEERYKTLVNRCELRGIHFEPQIKERFVDVSLLKELDEQCQLFKSVFYWFKDIYFGIRISNSSHSFSTPKFIDEMEYPIDEYTLVFNDTPDSPYDLNSYTNFTNIYEYPQRIFKVNENFLRANITRMIDIEVLMAAGYIRGGGDEEDKSYDRLLEDCLEGKLQNDYFEMASHAYRNYIEVKRYIDSQNYADSKLNKLENEYLIIKNQRFKGSYFNRSDFIIDRLILTKNGIFVCSLMNYGKKGQTLHITSDGKWILLDNDKNNPQESDLAIETSIIEDCALNCIAIKQILRNAFHSLSDNFQIYPLILIANDEVCVQNDTNHNIIRGGDIYAALESKIKSIESQQLQDIANEIVKFEISPEKISLPFYTQELKSIYSVYQEIYYDHLYILSRITDMLWEIKKADYYSSQIRYRKITTFIFSLGSVACLLRILIGNIINPYFAESYTTPTLWMFLMLVFISAGLYEYHNLLSWKEGRDKGECYEVKREYFLFGGFIPHIAVSLILTFLIKFILLRFTM